MKKLICFFICCVSLFCFSAGRAQTSNSGIFISGDWTYKENSGGITITDYRGNTEQLTIPSELDGRTVTQLGSELFYGNINLRSVYIPGTVLSIGAYAFYNCVSLEKVDLSFSIKKINVGTFQNCINLREIVLPRTVRTIDSLAFKNCRSLSSVFLPSVTSIGESAFEDCISLSNVMYGNRLSTVDSFAFRNTAWLDSKTEEFVFIGRRILLKWNGTGSEVTLPYGTASISGVFAENEELETVNLPETIRVIGKYAFRNAVNLKKINIPIYVATIDVSAFEGCRNLTDVEFPDLLSTIGSFAFRGCNKITEIVIPSRVKTIGSYAFSDCLSLQTVVLPDTTKINKNAFLGSDAAVLQVSRNSVGENFAKVYGVSYQIHVKELDGIQYYPDEDGIHISRYTGNKILVEIPGKIDGLPVTHIDSAAFQQNNCVRAVFLPASLKQIDDWAFSYMSNLEYVALPAGLKSLGSNVFTGSSALKEIRLPRRLQEIGSSPFDRFAADLKICVQNGSASSLLLEQQEYSLLSPDSCTIVNDPAAYQKSLSDCMLPKTANESVDGRVIALPEGLKILSSNLVKNLGESLILVIPASVESIEPEILDGREIIIVSQIGTAAERFAVENNIKFLVK